MTQTLKTVPYAKSQEVESVSWSGRGLKYTAEEEAAVLNAMREADGLTQGRFLHAFEDEFKQFNGGGPAFAVSSATAAIELAVLATQVGPGDEIIIPAHTFAATAIPFARAGCKIVWADIDPETRIVTADMIEPMITSATKGIVVVHLYGLVCDMDPIMELARKHDLLVMEDAAQSVGGRYKGRRCGSIGDFGMFSFHSHKNMSTLGEGGMLTVNNKAYADLIPGLRHNGMRAYTGDREQYWKPAMSNVDFDIEMVWPMNFCLGEVQCALGSKLLERIDQINQDKGQRSEKFMSALADYDELVFQKLPDGQEHTHHLLAAEVRSNEFHRDDLITLLNEKYSVKTVVQYMPLYRYPLFQRGGFGHAHCPHSDQFFDNMISFPFQHWMSESEFDYMLRSTVSAVDALRKGV